MEIEQEVNEKYSNVIINLTQINGIFVMNRLEQEKEEAIKNDKEPFDYTKVRRTIFSR